MATRRYSLAKGDTEFNVTEAVGAAVVTKAMEFTVDLAVTFDKEEVIRALKMLENHILKGNWPPA